MISHGGCLCGEMIHSIVHSDFSPGGLTKHYASLCSTSPWRYARMISRPLGGEGRYVWIILVTHIHPFLLLFR